MGDQPGGTARFVGDWIEIVFAHDLRITHALNGLEGRRLGMGMWRVPQSKLPELVRLFEPFNFTWEGDAQSAHREVAELEGRFKLEDENARLIKTGRLIFGDWQSPFPLLSHQRSGVEFLAARSGALLCDEQGLGKTLTALTAFWFLQQRGEASQLVVVCPNSLKHNWSAEIQTFYPDWRVVVASGPKASRRKAYLSDADVYLANYEAVRGDFSNLRLLLRRAPTVLVCDESHLAKNSDSRTAKALAFIRSAAARVWVMSGTPVPNKVEDAYAQVFVADGGRSLGTRESFMRRFIRKADPQSGVDDLKLVLEPILLRRTKEEVLDLPAKVFEERHVELRGKQRDLYNAIRGDLQSEVSSLSPDEFKASQTNVLTRLLRLSQVASNPRLVTSDFSGNPAKMLEIDALLEELIESNSRKVVLWSYYVRTIEEFLERYKKYDPVAIYGSIPIEDRAKAVERFQHEDSARLFIGNPQAAGTGLTLTASHYAIYETLTWRYDLYAQSLDRIHRIGQSSSVTYFNILGADTIDVEILERLSRKQAAAAELLGDNDRVPLVSQDEVLQMLARPLR